MNKSIFGFIFKTELKWKALNFGLICLAILSSLVIIAFRGPESLMGEFSQLAVYGLTFMFSFQSAMLASSSLEMSQYSQNSQMSWKYIHSIIKDRKGFLLGQAASIMVFFIPAAIYTLILKGTFNYDVLPSIWMIIPAIFYGPVLRLSVIYNTIKNPKRFTFKYGEENQIKRWVSNALEYFHFGIFVFILLSSLVVIMLSSMLFGKTISAFTAIMIPIVLSYILYSKILKAWHDESTLDFSHMKTFKSELKYAFSGGLVALMAYLATSTIPFAHDSQTLFGAAKSSDLAAFRQIEVLLEDHTKVDKNHNTVLHIAVQNKEYEMVDYLLQRGVNPNIIKSMEEGKKNRFSKTKKYAGMSPLQMAIYNRDIPMVKLLIGYGAKVNTHIEGSDISSLSLASMACSPQIMEVLIKNGANVNHSDGVGKTALFYSAHNGGCLLSVLILKKMGADIHLKNNDGLDYLQYAERKNRPFFMQLAYYQKLSQ